MLLRVGYEFIYDCPQPTPMVLLLNVHYSRAADIVVPDHLVTAPAVPLDTFRDAFGNWCTRIVAPAGVIKVSTEAVVRDSDQTDLVVPDARQSRVEDLPPETLQFLLGSRYCETDLLSQVAWDLFGQTPEGWPRVQAICDFVHERITFGYEHARATRTAWEAYNERTGVCRDYTHLAVALCRAMNIPARYCTGYLGDMGTELPWSPGDFAAWFEAYLDDRWYTFDPRNNVPRVGRVLIARGRDAADVSLSHSFGRATLTSFKVWTDEIDESTAEPTQR
ncbi:MAG: transglutaminase family protein [Dehalococcoidia bacterium]|nr:MAG: transglutaminase family protein [Dehalococcoidia bacterium]